MGRSCTVCTCPNRDEVDHLIVAGGSYRDIAGRFGLSRMAVHRHHAHVIAAMAEAQRVREAQATAKAAALADEVEARRKHEADHADDLLVQLRALQAKTIGLLMAAEEAGDRRTALIGIRAARENVELLAKLAGQLRDGAQVNIVTILGSESWQVIVSELRAAVEPFPPEVSTAIAGALARLGQRLGEGQGSPTPALAGSARG